MSLQFVALLASSHLKSKEITQDINIINKQGGNLQGLMQGSVHLLLYPHNVPSFSPVGSQPHNEEFGGDTQRGHLL